MIGDVASAIAVVCVAFMAWDLGRKYLGDRKLEYGKDVAILTRRCDGLDFDRTVHSRQIEAIQNVCREYGTALERVTALEAAHGTTRKLLSDDANAFNRVHQQLDELESRFGALARSVESPPDITKLVERQGVLEAAIKNMGTEARSEFAQRVTRAELEAELKNVRTVQAGMLAVGGRRR